MKSKSYFKVIMNRSFFVLILFFLALIISDGRKVNTNSIQNVNGAKSIEAVHIVTKYDNKDKKLTVKKVSSIAEAVDYGPSMPISFTGQMTAYNAKCVGCTGKVSCPPRQDVTKDNIYFEDNTYGKVRIIAADPNIPCGTIMQVTNLTFSKEPIVAIVLDRGSAIQGKIADLLVTESYNLNLVGRQYNANYEVLRWGW